MPDSDIRFRLGELERQFIEFQDEQREGFAALHAKLDTSTQNTAELLSLFNGGKTVVNFAKVAGRFTIAFGAFAGALTALWLWFKLLLIIAIKIPKP